MKRIAISAVFFLLAAAAAYGWEMCRGAVGSDQQQGWNLTEGMGYSIYFMLSMPFLVFGSFVGLLYWKVRKAARSEAESKKSN